MPIGTVKERNPVATLRATAPADCIVVKSGIVVAGFGVRDVHVRLEKGQLVWCGLYDPSAQRWEWPASSTEIERVISAIGPLPEE